MRSSMFFVIALLGGTYFADVQATTTVPSPTSSVQQAGNGTSTVVNTTQVQATVSTPAPVPTSATAGASNASVVASNAAAGASNTAAGATTAVAGASNTAAGATTAVAGASNTAAGATTAVAGASNTAAGATTAAAGASNTAAGASAAVAGTSNNAAGATTAAAGATTTAAGTTQVKPAPSTTTTTPTSASASASASPELVKKTAEVKFSLDRTYDKDLSNKSSTAYQTLKSNLSEAIEKDLSEIKAKVKDVTFSEGSVKVAMVIEYEAKSSQTTSLTSIVSTAISKEGSQLKSFGVKSVTVEHKGLNFTEWKVKSGECDEKCCDGAGGALKWERTCTAKTDYSCTGVATEESRDGKCTDHCSCPSAGTFVKATASTFILTILVLLRTIA